MRQNDYESLYRKKYSWLNCGVELFKKFYRAYDNMKTRCYNKNSPKYKSYGARNIKVCNEWLDSRNAFMTWCANNCNNLSLSLDRIDVDGNYSPDNCRWITMNEQARNKQNTVTVLYYGTEYCLRDLCRKLGYTTSEYKIIFSRIAYYNWDVTQAIETPVDHAKHNNSKHLAPSYTYKGYTNSLRQICKKFNLYYDTIRYRVMRGEDVKAACDKGTEKPYTYTKRRSKLGGTKRG